MLKFVTAIACFAAAATAQDQRVKLDTVSPFDNSGRLDKIELALNTDDLNKVVTASISNAIAGSDQMVNMVQQVADFRVKLHETYLTQTEFLSMSDAVKLANDQLTVEIDQARDDLAAANKVLSDASKDMESEITQNLKEVQDDADDHIEDATAALDGTDVVLANLKLSHYANNDIPVFRWNLWHTHQHRYSWVDGNRNTGFGGIHPSQWTDGNYRADQLANDFKYLQRLFIRKGTASTYGATICTKVYGQHSSTDGAVCGVLFRILNTGTSNIQWKPAMTLTSFTGWSEMASISLNGANIWNSDCSHECKFTPTITVPANSQKNRVSTIIVISTSSYPYGYSSTQERGVILMFRDDSLKLASGLKYVDDLDSLTGAWKK